MQKYNNIILNLLIIFFLCSCSKIVYVPTYKKSASIKVEPDIVRPVLLVNEKNLQIDKAKAIVQSYSICETRVTYLESILKGNQ